MSPLTRIESRERRRGRARAIQALYAWEMTGSPDLAKVAGRLFDDLAVTAKERELASQLLRRIITDQKKIDRQLADLTTNWRLERIGVIERCVLRVAAAELLGEETPPRVVMQEAVSLAERFGSPDSARFVNGVVDSLARELGRI